MSTGTTSCPTFSQNYRSNHSKHTPQSTTQLEEREMPDNEEIARWESDGGYAVPIVFRDDIASGDVWAECGPQSNQYDISSQMCERGGR